jgi:hypothetical protein
MVRLMIDIEALADDPKTVDIVLKTQKNQPAEVEETAARRLVSGLCDVAKAGFPEDESGK